MSVHFDTHHRFKTTSSNMGFKDKLHPYGLYFPNAIDSQHRQPVDLVESTWSGSKRPASHPWYNFFFMMDCNSRCASFCEAISSFCVEFNEHKEQLCKPMYKDGDKLKLECMKFCVAILLILDPKDSAKLTAALLLLVMAVAAILTSVFEQEAFPLWLRPTEEEQQSLAWIYNSYAMVNRSINFVLLLSISVAINLPYCMVVSGSRCCKCGSMNADTPSTSDNFSPLHGEENSADPETGLPLPEAWNLAAVGHAAAPTAPTNDGHADPPTAPTNDGHADPPTAPTNDGHADPPTELPGTTFSPLTELVGSSSAEEQQWLLDECGDIQSTLEYCMRMNPSRYCFIRSLDLSDQTAFKSALLRYLHHLDYSVQQQLVRSGFINLAAWLQILRSIPRTVSYSLWRRSPSPYISHDLLDVFPATCNTRTSRVVHIVLSAGHLEAVSGLWIFPSQHERSLPRGVANTLVGAVLQQGVQDKHAELCVAFIQNLLADETDITLNLGPGDLAGLPADRLAAARQAAADRNLGEEVYVITLSRSLVEPFITFSERRDLREKAWKLWTNRGELDANRDNLKVAREILALRVQQAQMHGYGNYAEYATADTMAGKPARVMELLERVWGPAKESIDRERAELEQYILAQSPGMTGDGANMVPWDWRYYAEKVRQKTHDLDEGEIKPYLPLDRMCEAIFDCANQLFGLTFTLRPDLHSYHPDVQTYEVRGAEGQLVAISIHDNYARPNKKPGAWMSEYRTQRRHDGPNSAVIPVIVNNNNFNKPAAGEACLLSFDDARTLFHEFGHGLHGMLSDVTYRRLAGTSVLRDFVELPSQLYEHWLSEPTVLQKHARHYQTGAPIPEELLQRMFRANKFGQGFATIEYAACVLVDIALHQLTDVTHLDITAFEQQELGRLGMPQGMVMRHRPAHFAHLFAGSGYASAYYVYLWAEVLDRDGFDAFLEAGSCFDPAVAQRVRQHVYSAGNSLDPAEAYRLFRQKSGN